MPPIDEIRDAVLQALLLPAGVAGVCFLILSRWLPRLNVAAFCAMLLGIMAGNHFRGAIITRIDPDRPVQLNELFATVAGTVQFANPLKQNRIDSRPGTIYWLPWAALIAGLAGVPARWSLISWVLSAVTSIITARLLVGPNLREQIPWLWIALAVVTFATWRVLHSSLSKSGGLTVLGLTAAFLAAAVVLLHAHSARLADMALLLAGGCLGIAVVAFVSRIDPAGLAPIAAVMLPGLMLAGQRSTFSDVPMISFALVGLSPLTILLGWIFGRYFVSLSGAWLGWILFLLVNGLAVGLAIRSEDIATL